MAERRMFSKKVTDSDQFIELSASAQALYFHLNQSADDDGFNNQIQNALFKAHASLDDLKVLMVKKFIIRFESGVIVIRHWRMHNTLRKDRYNPTNFREEFAKLGIADDGSYTDGCQMVAGRLPNGCQMVAPGKDRLGKDSIGEVNNTILTDCIGHSDECCDPKSLPKKPKAKRFVPPTVAEVTAYCQERRNSINPEAFVDFYASKGWMVGKNPMKDWKAAVRTWERSEGRGHNGSGGRGNYTPPDDDLEKYF
mgnify:FL=1